MSSVPSVSVVLATSGRSATLEQQLGALAGQEDAPPFEVVLVANRANGALDTVPTQWAGPLSISLVIADSKVGVSYARNVGIAASRGTKLLFVDDDDVVSSNYVAAMAAELDRHPAVGARMDVAELNRGWRSQVRTVGQMGHDRPEAFPFVYGAALGVRKDVIDRVGGFDETLDGIAGEDVEWGVRLRRAGYEFGFVPDAVVYYRLRTGYRDLFRQGYRYGRGGQIVSPDWTGWGSWLRTLAGPVRLVVMGPGPGMRRRGVFLVGRRLGRAAERRSQPRGA